jgi:cytochrome b561
MSAVVVIGMFASGWWMVELNYYSDWYRTAPFIHKSVGVLLLLLTLARLCWKASNTSPDAVGNTFEQFMAKATHTVLYLLIVVICVSGYLISTADGRGIEVFNWFVLPSFGELFPQQADTAGFIHKYSAYGLMGLVLLHALAALKHHFIDKDNTLKRML